NTIDRTMARPVALPVVPLVAPPFVAIPTPIVPVSPGAAAAIGAPTPVIVSIPTIVVAPVVVAIIAPVVASIVASVVVRATRPPGMVVAILSARAVAGPRAIPIRPAGLLLNAPRRFAVLLGFANIHPATAGGAVR